MTGYFPASSPVDFFAWNGANQIWDTTANSNAGGWVNPVDANVANYRLPTTAIVGGNCSAADIPGMFRNELRLRSNLLSTSYVVYENDCGAGLTQLPIAG